MIEFNHVQIKSGGTRNYSIHLVYVMKVTKKNDNVIYLIMVWTRVQYLDLAIYGKAITLFVVALLLR